MYKNVYVISEDITCFVKIIEKYFSHLIITLTCNKKYFMSRLLCLKKNEYYERMCMFV